MGPFAVLRVVEAYGIGCLILCAKFRGPLNKRKSVTSDVFYILLISLRNSPEFRLTVIGNTKVEKSENSGSCIINCIKYKTKFI